MASGWDKQRSEGTATGVAVGPVDVGVGKRTLTEAISPGQLALKPADTGHAPGPTQPGSQVPSAASEDARVSTTAGKPQLAQRGHAMQYYRLHQPAFLDAVCARLLAANLDVGSPGLFGRAGPRASSSSSGSR